ncbi:MAG: leucyl aminopeptidase family protein [bacterium]|nr:leucyl aminopeptidase family protein [bacterium]MDZ4285944.1 leucyl aminopeptidase family protein [Candidatus Sungbacteria bacterium]
MKITAVTIKEAAQKENVLLALAANNPVQQQEFFSFLSKENQTSLKAFAAENFKAEEGEIRSLWLGSKNPKRIVLFGLGDRAKWNERKNPLIARKLVQYAKKEGFKEFATFIPKDILTDTKDMSVLFTTNALMADFVFDIYKEKQKDAKPKLETIYIGVDSKDHKALTIGITEGIIIGEETNRCRTLANTPGGDMTPTLLAKEASDTAKRAGFKATIFNEKKMRQLGMGAILGVGRGSDAPPRFIILEYLKGPKNQKPLVLVGKGVTFDTGGLNLKPDNYIYEMHMDMSGGAAVIHGIASIARLKLPINVVGLIPAVENMPSGSSYRPGDQLKSLSGKTIEVLNTDAEGRVILADALTYGLRYKPEVMIDLATLTGAAHVALGSHCSAVFSNDAKLQEHLIDIGNISGDYLWPLPLWDEFLPEIKGTFGDLANIGNKDRYGGASHGAKFLEQFAGDTRFAHLDIAPRMTAIDSDFLSKGASGVGVRLITQLAKEYPEILNSKS